MNLLNFFKSAPPALSAQGVITAPIHVPVRLPGLVRFFAVTQAGRLSPPHQTFISAASQGGCIRVLKIEIDVETLRVVETVMLHPTTAMELL